jgi:hypothetical protein
MSYTQELFEIKKKLEEIFNKVEKDEKIGCASKIGIKKR